MVLEAFGGLAELSDGGGFVAAGLRERFLRRENARLHVFLAEDAIEGHATKKRFENPRALELMAVQWAGQKEIEVVERLGEVPVAGLGVPGFVQAIYLGDDFVPVGEG